MRDVGDSSEEESLPDDDESELSEDVPIAELHRRAVASNAPGGRAEASV